MHVHVLDVGLTRKSIVTVLVYMNNVIIICMNNLNSNSFIVMLFKSNIRYINIEYSTYAIWIRYPHQDQYAIVYHIRNIAVPGRVKRATAEPHRRRITHAGASKMRGGGH